MKVTTEYEQKPDVIVTLTWKEATVLRAIGRGVLGRGPSQNVIYMLEDRLSEIGVPSCGPKFSGSFRND